MRILIPCAFGKNDASLIVTAIRVKQGDRLNMDKCVNASSDRQGLLTMPSDVRQSSSINNLNKRQLLRRMSDKKEMEEEDCAEDVAKYIEHHIYGPCDQNLINPDFLRAPKK